MASTTTARPATPTRRRRPIDSDRDGTPDFRDTDSDNNGRADGVDGTGDLDGDGQPDFQDLDDDGDGILDATELGDPLAPRDTDGDGVPDFQDLDSDGDGLADADEGTSDSDGDGVGDWADPRNDGPPPTVSFTAISTTFNNPIGIDFHEPTNSVVMSVNYADGLPLNFERVELDGTHVPFSSERGLTDEVKIATVRSGNVGGFVTGDLFVGNGLDGQITRITDDGATIMNPWVVLPGTGHGLMRGSLYIDRTGVFGGDLLAVTTLGAVWRITSAGAPTMLAAVGVHLEGMIVVPPFPARFGPLAGKIIAGAEGQGLLYAFDTTGAYTTYTLGVAVEDVDLVMPGENFFGVNYGTGRLLGVPKEVWRPIVGDVLLTTETVVAGASGLFRIYWDGVTLSAQALPLDPGSATVGQWEHNTFANAGIAEIP
ncbi:MAG: hypothetical protein IPL61_37215 [Myxococcales bacterium]|nr:hypothetical protein [Myxococcales bacterium]